MVPRQDGVTKRRGRKEEGRQAWRVHGHLGRRVPVKGWTVRGSSGSSEKCVCDISGLALQPATTVALGRTPCRIRCLPGVRPRGLPAQAHQEGPAAEDVLPGRCRQWCRDGAVPGLWAGGRPPRRQEPSQSPRTHAGPAPSFLGCGHCLQMSKVSGQKIPCACGHRDVRSCRAAPSLGLALWL